MFLIRAPPYNYCCHGIMCPKDFFDTRLGYKARSVLSETELWGGDVLGSQVSQPSRPWNGRHWYSNSHPLCSRPTRCKTTHQVKAATLHTVNNNLSSQIRKFKANFLNFCLYPPPEFRVGGIKLRGAESLLCSLGIYLRLFTTLFLPDRLPPSVPVSQEVSQIRQITTDPSSSKSSPHHICLAALHCGGKWLKIGFPRSNRPLHRSPRCPRDSRPTSTAKAARSNNSPW